MVNYLGFFLDFDVKQLNLLAQSRLVLIIFDPKASDILLQFSFKFSLFCFKGFPANFGKVCLGCSIGFEFPFIVLKRSNNFDPRGNLWNALCSSSSSASSSATEDD